jgi:hypothetical protein
VAGLNRPVPALPGIPRPYRGRGNRGKVPALPLRDKTGIAGKKKTEQIFTLEQEAAGLKRQVHTLARLKSATGPLRPEQAAFIELVAAACGVVFVVRNCADVVRELKL